MQKHENLDKFVFRGSGSWDIPDIVAQAPDCVQWIPLNYAMTHVARKNVGIHCFVDDQQLVRLWNEPDRYLATLRRFGVVCSPDYSLYSNMPAAVQLYNHYRKHWLAAYWQQHGICVLPSISWSTPESYQWCFRGEPTHATVIVSSVGTQRSEESKDLFLRGYQEMCRRLEPEQILFYGVVPEGCQGNILEIAPYYQKIKEARLYKHGR